MNYTSLIMNLGIQGAIHNDEYRARCPFHQDSSPSFYMNTKTGLAICHRGCFRGNFVQLVERTLDCTFHEAHDWIAHNGNKSAVEDLVQQVEDFFKPKVPILSGPLTPVFEPWREVYESLSNKEMPQWFFDRGFTWETVNHWDIRYNPGVEGVTVPIKWEGELIGTVTRQLYGTPKYLNSEFPKSEIWVGEISQATNYIIIVEGLLDAIWLWQLGYNAVTPLGAYVSQAQVQLLRKFRYSEIICALDNDAAGQAGTQDLTSKLQLAGYLLPQISYIRFPSNRKDAQDCSSEEFRDLYMNRKGFLG